MSGWEGLWGCNHCFQGTFEPLAFAGTEIRRGGAEQGRDVLSLTTGCQIDSGEQAIKQQEYKLLKGDVRDSGEGEHAGLSGGYLGTGIFRVCFSRWS